jgi:hypothetical protein
MAMTQPNESPVEKTSGRKWVKPASAVVFYAAAVVSFVLIALWGHSHQAVVQINGPVGENCTLDFASYHEVMFLAIRWDHQLNDWYAYSTLNFPPVNETRLANSKTVKVDVAYFNFNFNDHLWGFALPYWFLLLLSVGTMIAAKAFQGFKVSLKEMLILIALAAACFTITMAIAHQIAESETSKSMRRWIENENW